LHTWHREDIGWLAGLTAVVSLLLLIASWRLELGFTVYVVLWFVLCLGIFHAGFANTSGLTQTQVRKIDYWYLGASAVAVFLTASLLPTQRNEYLKKIPLPAFEKEEVIRDVQEYIRWSCDDRLVPPAPHQCAAAGTLLDRLSGTGEVDYAAEAEKFRAMLVQENSPQERDTEIERQFYRFEQVVLEDLNFGAYYFQTLRERGADKREGRYPPSIEPLYLGLQTFFVAFCTCDGNSIAADKDDHRGVRLGYGQPHMTNELMAFQRVVWSDRRDLDWGHAVPNSAHGIALDAIGPKLSTTLDYDMSPWS
jgi:hypothetical protein